MSEVNHVGLTVGDVDKAARWYVETFGFRLLDAPVTVNRSSPGRERRDEIFGSRLGSMRLAHLVGDNGCGLELFEFIDPPTETPEERFVFWRIGAHHIAVTVDDVGATAERVAATGGRTRSRVHRLDDACAICYAEDPWGNVLELVSVSYTGLENSWHSAIDAG